jgi:hypothetical protein
MRTVIELWQRATATRYTRALEAEVARLRAENRALLNSILGIAGVPPITVETAPLEEFAVPAIDTAVGEVGNRKEPSWWRSLGMAAERTAAQPRDSRQHQDPPLQEAQGWGTRKDNSNGSSKGERAGETPALQKRAQAAPPMRRRSWQQINRALEFASARKERPGAVPEVAGASNVRRD